MSRKAKRDGAAGSLPGLGNVFSTRPAPGSYTRFIDRPITISGLKEEIARLPEEGGLVFIAHVENTKKLDGKGNEIDNWVIRQIEVYDQEPKLLLMSFPPVGEATNIITHRKDRHGKPNPRDFRWLNSVVTQMEVAIDGRGLLWLGVDTVMSEDS